VIELQIEIINSAPIQQWSMFFERGFHII